jgi:hypothetical protein
MACSGRRRSRSTAAEIAGNQLLAARPTSNRFEEAGQPAGTAQGGCQTLDSRLGLRILIVAGVKKIS